MLHPRLTPLGGTPVWLAQIGPYGAWGELAYTTRFGDGPCGMYEASWTMPLPADFDHPALRRGTLVELMDGPYRVGSSLVLAEPARGTGLDNPWTLTATGLGSEVTGTNSFYALDGSGSSTSIASVAVDSAIARGLQWAGRDSTVPTFAIPMPTGELITIGAMLSTIADQAPTYHHWGVGQENLVGFLLAPTTPTYHVVPGVVSLGVADDDYATVVLFRYLDSTTHTYATAVAGAPAAVANRYGRREYAVDRTDLGEIGAATAQAFADGILAQYGGRLGWTNGLSGLTSNDILTEGGVPASLSKVSEDVGNGCMVRIHGIFNDLLEYNGQTWLDIIVGEAKYVDGAQTIDLNPMGLAARDLASVVEAVSGPAAA